MKYKYTKYEISKLVKDELEKSGLSKEEFCEEQCHSIVEQIKQL